MIVPGVFRSGVAATRREASGDATSAAKNYSTRPLISPTREAMKEALFESFCYEPITAVHTIYEVNWSAWTVLINSRILLRVKWFAQPVFTYGKLS